MLKAIVFAVIAACGVPTTTATAEPPPPDQPDDFARPPAPPPEEQHWCCQSVNHKTKSGDGCDPISGSLETIAACNQVLYCPGFWTKDNGKVICE
jgi:hypothetical protein